MEVRRRFKGLDLIDRVTDELWTEVLDIVQETRIKTILKTKKCKKSKMAVWRGLTNSCEKKRSKGEKERYTHLNAKFQRMARRQKKAFLSTQCKEVDENCRIGKTRDLIKKIRATKRTFNAKMGSIKKRSKRQRKKGKINPSECRVSKTSKDR